jgi:hypothetical protein
MYYNLHLSKKFYINMVLYNLATDSIIKYAMNVFLVRTNFIHIYKHNLSSHCYIKKM